MLVIAPKRETDTYGSGHYQAPRGNRKHNGQDYACAVGSKVLSPVNGLVSKLGYAYADDLSFRYVQITDEEGVDTRVFYIEPVVSVGYRVSQTSTLGISQKLSDRYPKDEKHKTPITEHFHVECFKRKEGKKHYIDPLEYLK